MNHLGLTMPVLLGAALSGLLGTPQDKKPATLYFFLSPGAGSAPEAAERAVRFIRKHKGDVRLRPVLLIEEFRALRCASQDTPFFKALRKTRGDLVEV